MLGVLARQSARHAEALYYLEQAIARQLTVAIYHVNYANALRAQPAGSFGAGVRDQYPILPSRHTGERRGRDLASLPLTPTPVVAVVRHRGYCERWRGVATVRSLCVVDEPATIAHGTISKCAVPRGGPPARRRLAGSSGLARVENRRSRARQPGQPG